MSDQPLGPGWWQASDGKYYPPETGPGDSAPATPGFSPDATPPGALGTPGAGPWDAPSYQHGPYAYSNEPPRSGTNGLAIASLVCSVLGLCTCILAIVGVVLGHIALSQLGRVDNTQEGRGLAIAGLAVGYGIIGLSLLWVVFVVVAGS
jgi:hypothetical protein